MLPTQRLAAAVRELTGAGERTAAQQAEPQCRLPQAIQAFVDQGEEALLSELERWEPEARVTVARALAEVA